MVASSVISTGWRSSSSPGVTMMAMVMVMMMAVMVMILYGFVCVCVCVCVCVKCLLQQTAGCTLGHSLGSHQNALWDYERTVKSQSNTL